MPVLNKLGATLYSTAIDNNKVTPSAIFSPLGLPSGFFVSNTSLLVFTKSLPSPYKFIASWGLTSKILIFDADSPSFPLKFQWLRSSKATTLFFSKPNKNFLFSSSVITLLLPLTFTVNTVPIASLVLELTTRTLYTARGIVLL